MKKYIYIKAVLPIVLIMILATSCFKDLDTVPLDEDIITSAVVFDNPDAYLNVLAKVYGGLALSGQQGPAGAADIEGIDEGFGQYLRGYWYHQELSTDESVIGWNDQTIRDFHDQDWNSDDGFIFAFYSRIFYQIVLCNEYLRETSDAKLSERGVDATLADQIKGYRAEVRFLRALSYWHALDLFRNVPFVTEEDAVGSFFPEQIQAADLFNYIESELLAIENEIGAANTNPYGRADQGAVWTLLAKLYLNAESYGSGAHYTECVTYCNKVINAGYTLEPIYQNLFGADNHLSNEIIFPVTFDGINTRTYGGTTFLVRAPIGGTMNPVEFGIASGWGGTRTTRQFVEKFPVSTDLVVAPNEGQTVSYRRIYLPGLHQGWNGSNTKSSIAAGTGQLYEGHIYFPTDNSPFLIYRNPGFGGRLGDNNGDGILETNGDTLYTGPAGLYFIEVNLATNEYRLERRNWSIVGSAVPGGGDLDMTWNPATEALEANVDLTAGEFHFIANDDAAISLGDNNANAILTYNGSGINIGSGSYLIRLFPDRPDYTYEIRLTSFDRRGNFYTSGQTLDIVDISMFTQGYAIEKFRNITSAGTPGSDTEYPDTDFPMFRLGDVLLMASEALVRGGGDRSLALEYFNRVRTRAYQGGGGNITDAELTLQTLIDERARELHWEGHRRTDLVRFGQFSQTDYVWAWKGGVAEGKSVESFRDVYPIPSPDLSANPNLVQNPGY